MENQSPVAASQSTNGLSFIDAMQELIDGRKITRIDWDNDDYGFIKDGWISIHRNGLDHRWIISDGDYLANDWKVLQ